MKSGSASCSSFRNTDKKGKTMEIKEVVKEKYGQAALRVQRGR